MLLLPFILGEGFNDGLFIGVRGVPVLLVQLASFSSKPCSFTGCCNVLESTLC